MVRTALASIVCAIVLSSSACPAAGDIPVPRGFFVLRSARGDQPVPPAILDDVHVAGVSLRRSWASINPGAGRFDFAYLDREIAAAALHGKSVMLHVDANGDDL